LRQRERERGDYDEVTGLPGRTLLLRALDDLLRHGNPFALVCVDFDGLREVNNTLGYEAGNELIRVVGQTLAGLLRPGEMVGRLHGRGGDEFVCLLTERDHAGVDARCRSLEAALDRAPVPARISPHYLGASVGASLADGGGQAGVLFENAEKAMRERKKRRKLEQGRAGK
jgi:diguanylate cyclase (GGDEF)-like protein